MICKQCGTLIEDETLVCCPKCGMPINIDKNTIKIEGIEGIREGKMPLKGQERYIPPKIENDEIIHPWDKGVPMSPQQQAPHVKHVEFKSHTLKGKTVNWAHWGILIITIVLIIVGAVIYFFRSTESGQIILARKFKATSPQAYWLVADDFMNSGDIVNAIRAYTLADQLDPDNVDGLLELAATYEAGDYDKQAEAIYLRIIQDLSPTRVEPYRAIISMMLNNDRTPEACEMMKLAYENTENKTFNEQRNQTLPNIPKVSLPGGRYDTEKSFTLSSPQNYDIYYIIDDGTGVLPDDGILYDGKSEIPIPEGNITVRAVCTSLDLVSDPLTVNYKLIYPSPSAPKANLAPGTYSKSKTVDIRPGDDDENVVMHYTIDGSIPDENSPIYDGTSIELPNGRVTLRAISVNQKGKISNTREVGYKIDAKPYMKQYYNEEDKFGDFEIYSTKLTEFTDRLGMPDDQQDTTTYMSQINAQAKTYIYNWGKAEFILTSNKWLLVNVETKSNITTFPRGLGIGSTKDEVINSYKDMGQLPNLDGTRGLYYSMPNIGRLTNDGNGNWYIHYAVNNPANNKVWAIDYMLENDIVKMIKHYWIP